MENKIEIVDAVKNLNVVLNKYHNGSATAEYVQETLTTLEKSDGVAFTGAFQYFLNRFLIVKLSDNIKFNETEKKSWKKVSSFVELGNNLWGARL